MVGRLPGNRGLRGIPRYQRMSGSNTRPGFCGGDEPPSSNPEEALSPRAARTIIGHEIHRPVPADPHRAASVPSSPQAPIGVPETVTYETTDEIPRRPSHSRKTKFPVLMRWFGRLDQRWRFPLAQSHVPRRRRPAERAA